MNEPHITHFMLCEVIGPNTSMVRTDLQTNSCPSQAHCIILENSSCLCYCINVATGYPGFNECLSKYGCHFKMFWGVGWRSGQSACLPVFPPQKTKNNLNSNLTRIEAAWYGFLCKCCNYMFSPRVDFLFFGSSCLSNEEIVEILSQTLFYFYLLNIYYLLTSSCRPCTS